eukprot:GDKI01031760.1.p1 GENE.GDKI01031760.1~~GDKI01031760.1.p1  ORF type:complete len:301 (+),score=57.76 GDKI01031760.1:96-998(+)
MADTVDLNEIHEHVENDDVVLKKTQTIAELIAKSKHMTFFTGAGISTAAKIPDFRGPEGVWTRKAQGRAPPKSADLLTAQPTHAHMCVKRLYDMGVVKQIVSQNVDGLHLRSGIPRNGVCELHGNCFLEVCWSCETEYLRDYEVMGNNRKKCEECRKRVPYFCHCTKRKCDKCGSKLKDSVIHFEEDLPKQDMNRAFEHANKSDLVLVLGSSLRVTPACEVPETTVNKGGKMCIVNLQETPMDNLATVRIHCKTDRFFQLLMPLLEERGVLSGNHGKTEAEQRLEARNERKRKADNVAGN